MFIQFRKIRLKNEKALFIVLITLLIILTFIYCNFIISKSFARESFANDAIKLSDENEKSIFNIQKILFYSSANAIDNTEEQSLQNLSICQFTDIAIYIDNTSSISDLTGQNTVNRLYIDNININQNSSLGHHYLTYKSALDFGKFKALDELSSDKIEYEIINTNAENESQDYKNPTFYTDCSNPITLEYMNKDLLTNYSVTGDANTISFNGKVLQETNISLKDISYTLTFRINIINNENEKFIYNMTLPIDLTAQNNSIYNGYLFTGKNTSGTEYQFFKEL